jgi:2-polyprenyl-3-methyl-5-hydroxy-6-metoxy-1,4-benzoquinol methylase
MKRISLYEFGGTEDLVRRTQERFVTHFRSSSPVLDIGCGRGVFIDLLCAAGIEAVGIDHSQESVAACLKKGLTVYPGGAIDFLQGNPRKFGGIFCSHVIEHMHYDDAMRFLELCHGALEPGGKLLLVTPNPEDLSVIAEIFWLDPTHVRPYPKKLLLTMVDAAGFENILDDQYLGSWKMVGRRNLLSYIFRRLLLGRYFGRPNTMVLAKKSMVPEIKLG